MACNNQFNINPKNAGDMPLNSAIYSVSQDCIYACRGAWVYKFSAVTGAKIAEYRFRKDVIFSESYIIEFGGFLYLATWRAALEDGLSSYPAGQDVFKVNYALNTSVGLGLGPLCYISNRSGPQFFGGGFGNLVADSTRIYGSSTIDAREIFKLDPTNVPGVITDSFQVQEHCAVKCIAIDTANAVMWFTATNLAEVWAKTSDFTVPGGEAHSSSIISTTLGVCVIPNASPTGVKVFYVTGSDTVVMANVAAAYASLPALSTFGTTDFTLPDTDTQPMRIRYNSYNGLVYVPGWINDKVYVYNPAPAYPSPPTLVGTFTGFLSPIDCVFTPTRRFAVQDSAAGLREII